MIGLVVFTLASLWCGLSGGVEMLIVARVFQGLGAAMRPPDDGRHHPDLPADKRGTAMGLWGSVAGVATLVGPILGGVAAGQPRLAVDLLRQRARRRGRASCSRGAWSVPADEQPQVRHDRSRAQRRSACSASSSGCRKATRTTGMRAVGPDRRRPRRDGCSCGGRRSPQRAAGTAGPVQGPQLLVANVGIAAMGFSITGVMLPFMFYAQSVTGLSPTRSALLMAPRRSSPASSRRSSDASRQGAPRMIAAPVSSCSPSRPHGWPRGSPDHPGMADPVADGDHRCVQRIHLGTAGRHRDAELPPMHVGAGSGVYTPPVRSAPSSVAPRWARS
ncbi:hypothetical protein GS943_11890 [Rhodococcus hoagii]|nr:hypothetical protein [Prescottella equi]